MTSVVASQQDSCRGAKFGSLMRAFGMFWFGLIALGQSAYAVKGTYLEPGSNPPGACLLVTLDTKSAQVIGTCSAVLVAPTLLITAAHCKSDSDALAMQSGNRMKLRRAVSCEGSGLIQEVEEFQVRGNFLEESGGDPKYDLAIASVAKPFALPLAQLPKSSDHFLSLQKKNNCMVCGQGLDNKNEVGELHCASVQFSYSPDDNGLLDIGANADGTSPLAVGDSGGGLYCLDSNNVPYLMGANNRVVFSKYAQATALNDHWNWLKAKLLPQGNPIVNVKTLDAQICKAGECLNAVSKKAIGLVRDTASIIETLRISLNSLSAEYFKLKAENYPIDSEVGKDITLTIRIRELKIRIDEIFEKCGSLASKKP